MLKGGAYIDWMVGGDLGTLQSYDSLGIGFKGDYYFFTLSDKFYIGTGLNLRLSLLEKNKSVEIYLIIIKKACPLDLNWRIIEFNVVI